MRRKAWDDWWRRNLMYHGEPVTLRRVVLLALTFTALVSMRGVTGYRKYGPDIQPSVQEQIMYGGLLILSVALILWLRRNWK